MQRKRQTFSAFTGRAVLSGVAGVLLSWSVQAQSAQPVAEQPLVDRIAERRDAAAAQVEAETLPVEPTAGVRVGDKQIDSVTGRVVAGDPLSATQDDLTVPEVEPRAEELLPLGRVASDQAVTGGDTQMPKLGGGWVLNTMAALGVVIGLILGLRWLAKRSGAVKTASLDSPAVEMLSRTTIAPRNHVVLLRVGPRVLVVNDSGQGMRTLANIDDPDEVAELLRSVQVQQEDSATRSFAGVMTRLARGTDRESDYGDDSEASIGQARDSLAGLRGRLAALTGTSGSVQGGSRG